MAAGPDRDRSAAEVRREIEAQRAELAESVERLRRAADPTSMLRAKLPLIAAGTLGAGFFLAGGVGATMRLLARRSREGRETARVGRFSIIEHD